MKKIIFYILKKMMEIALECAMHSFYKLTEYNEKEKAIFGYHMEQILQMLFFHESESNK